ncbi:gamma-glutamyltransferase family protein [Acidiferrobacter sp.]|uniref:gamma-glutamyltransferase family protein n=1 Tax=Acidiferrobacter sp. TaxID=1872107 RepID=UPI0026052207|nr:gamma-glutamyltransferase [Acidiferrobacter sp.]
MLAQSRTALITTPHPDATGAGLTILRAGGNAIEAALAAAAMLCVVYPHMTGLGGDACWLVAKDEGEPLGILGIGQAAAAKPPDAEHAQRGPAAAFTTAGAVDSWGLAYQFSRESWAGRLGWPAIMAPAIARAKDGYAVSQSQAFWYKTHREELSGQPGFKDTFDGPHGRCETGCRQTQGALAATLSELAEHGPRHFYEGPLAARLAAGLRAAGSVVTSADLKATRALYVRPLAVSYRGGVAFNMPPPTQGVTALQILHLLNRFEIPPARGDDTRFYVLLIEAIKTALADRNRFVADPTFVPVPVHAMLHSEGPVHGHHDAGASAPEAMDPALPGDTVWIGVRDPAGGSVSLIQSLFFDFGSGVMAGDTGVLWHNRGAAFSPTIGHPNAWAPGKRPLHTLSPGLYRKQGKVRVIYGSQGGDGQPQALAHILTRIVDFGLDPFTALARPRIHVGPTFLDTRKGIKIETNADMTAIQDLQQFGYPIEIVSALNPGTGQAGAITIDASGGLLLGAYDPRSDGLCLGL